MAIHQQAFHGTYTAPRVKVRNTFIDIDEVGEAEERRHRRYRTLPIGIDEHVTGYADQQTFFYPEPSLPILLGSVAATSQAEQGCDAAARKVRLEANRNTCDATVKVKNTFIEIDHDNVSADTPARRRGFRTCPDVSECIQNDAVGTEEIGTDASSRPHPLDRKACFGADEVVRRSTARANRRNNFGTEDLRELLLNENAHPWKINDQPADVEHSEHFVEDCEGHFPSRNERQVYYRTDDRFEPLKVRGSSSASSHGYAPESVLDASTRRISCVGQSEQMLTSPEYSRAVSSSGVRSVVLPSQHGSVVSPGGVVPWPSFPPGMDHHCSYPLMMLASSHASVSSACAQAEYIGGPAINLQSTFSQGPTQIPHTVLMPHHSGHPPLPERALVSTVAPATMPPPQASIPCVSKGSADTVTSAAQAAFSSMSSAAGVCGLSSDNRLRIEAMLTSGPDNVSPNKDSATTRPHNKRPLRLWAHIYLHMATPGFDLVPMLIGRGGANMRKIADATNAKIRVRGRGSGHLEVNGTSEAPTPLMVAVTSDKRDNGGFKSAVEMTVAQLRIVERRFRGFCEKEGRAVEGPCFSIGLLTEGAEELLGDALDGVQFGHIARGGALVLGRGSGSHGCVPSATGASASGEAASSPPIGANAASAVAARGQGVANSSRAEPR